jgi:peptidoglycan/LPS O-acetylase OafA/YrhL
MVAFTLSVLLAPLAVEGLENAPLASLRNASRIDVLETSIVSYSWHTVAHVLLVHGIVPDSWLPFAAYAFLGQAWNISTEFQFYLIVPGIFWLLTAASPAARAAGLVALGSAWVVSLRWPNAASLAILRLLCAWDTKLLCASKALPLEVCHRVDSVGVCRGSCFHRFSDINLDCCIRISSSDKITRL